MSHQPSRGKLIDLRTDEPWGSRKRSLQVFRCYYCQALTNHIDSYKYRGRHYICSHEKQGWHQTLEAKLEKFADKSHPKFYLDELEKEIRETLSRTITNDLVGNPDLSQEGNFNLCGEFERSKNKRRRQ